MRLSVEESLREPPVLMPSPARGAHTRFIDPRTAPTIKYLCTKEGFSAETPLGERFEAKFDGKDYPVEDDPGHTMVSVKRLNASSVELTSKRNGKIVGVLHLSVAPSGETIHVVVDDRESDTTSTYEMQKQP